MAGGWLSDRFGRRRMLALYIAAMSVPTLLLAWQMQGAGWIHPIDPTAAGHRLPTPQLVMQFWTAALTYAFFNGLMYGTRTALFMDVTVPRVAATQFTAYMAMLNFVISYSAAGRGWPWRAGAIRLRWFWTECWAWCRSCCYRGSQRAKTP